MISLTQQHLQLRDRETQNIRSKQKGLWVFTEKHQLSTQLSKWKPWIEVSPMYTDAMNELPQEISKNSLANIYW